jgi:cytochrome oxidase assembly protein ShyY1
MQLKRTEAAMAESMVSIVVGLAVIAIAAILLTHQVRREHHRERLMSRFHAHRLWDRLRHRH